MARSPSGLPSDRRVLWSNAADSESPRVIREVDGCQDSPWPRVLSPQEAAESGLGKDDVAALEVVAEALFRNGALNDDTAAQVFDRVFGWAMSQDFGSVDIAPDTMARIAVRRAS